MLELNDYCYSNTLKFEVINVDKAPENAYDNKNWEQGRGAYYVKESDTIYLVGKYSVDVIYSVGEKGFFTVVDDVYESPKVEESLFLKAIAAAHGHNL